MLLEYNQIIGLKVSSPTGKELGKVTDIYLNPKNCRLQCLIINKNKFVKTIDIRTWQSSIQINSVKNLKALSNYDHKGQSLIKRKVYTEKRKYLGEVEDMILDTRLNSVTNFIVSKKLLFIKIQKRQINWREILEITPDRIIVKNDLKTKKSKEQIAMEGGL